MDIKFVLNRIRRRLHSRVRPREVMRRAYWLEFENESILSFLAKYNIVAGCQQSPIRADSRSQDFIDIENDPEFIINIIEAPNS